MTTHNAQRAYPRLLNYNITARNGMVPQGQYARRIAEGINHIVAYRRKLIAFFPLDAGSVPAGLASDNDVWYFHCRTGFGCAKIRVVVMVAPGGGSGTDPTVYASFNGTDSTRLHFNQLAGNDAPERFSQGQIDYAVSEDTAYAIELAAGDYARPLSVCIYEMGADPVDTSNGGTVDPNAFATGMPITDATVQDLLEAQRDQLKRNRKPFLSWSRRTAANAPTVSGIAYTNILDGNTGSPSGSTAGFKVDLTYLNTYSQTTVPIIMWVRAEQTTAGSGTVKIIDDAGTTIATTTAITSAGWYSVTANVTAGEIKFDIQARTLLGGQTLRIDAVCAYVDGTGT